MSRITGRPRTPQALKDLRGNPGKEARRGDEVVAAPAKNAEPPHYLPQAARRIWDEVAPGFLATHRLAQEDIRQLATACRLQALGEQQLAEVEAGRVGRGTGNLWAAVKLLDKAGAIFGRFGMTPSDRAKLTIRPLAPAAGKFTTVLSA